MINYCLKIKTFDNRNFYTDIKNYKKIISYKNCLYKQISKVRYEEQILLSLKNLAIAITDNTFNDKKIIKKNINLSNEIKNYIKDSFEKNSFLNFKNLKDKFKDCDVTTANLYNYLNNIKKIYKKDGKEIKRIKSGIFKIIPIE
jgi:hypothetical protein